MGVLSATFPGRWIGKGGSSPWSPRSPDLTPFDSLFWGHVKNYVYAYMDKVRAPDYFKARTREATGTVLRDTLQRVWQEE
jgi:hypothetical protein